MHETLLYPCEVQCPYCGELNSLELEFIAEAQSLYHDCAACCCPMELRLAALEAGSLPQLEALSADA